MTKCAFFPVRAQPLRMQAGLHKLGTDFGNGPRDARVFLADDERSPYLAAKREAGRLAGTSLPLRSAWAETQEGRRQLSAVAAWAWRRALEDDACEGPSPAPSEPATAARCGRDAGALSSDEVAERAAWDGVSGDVAGEDGASRLGALALAVQEDLVVLARDSDGREQASFVDVRFPSGWRPERIVGADFRAIHDPVPDFADDALAAESMVRAMLERGPYVRFVWTVCADEALDHHPDHQLRRPFTASSRAWLRVERQVTVPLVEVAASLFAIRTYLWECAALTADQRHILHEAIRLMPEDIARYKGLSARDLVHAAIDRPSAHA